MIVLLTILMVMKLIISVMHTAKGLQLDQLPDQHAADVLAANFQQLY